MVTLFTNILLNEVMQICCHGFLELIASIKPSYSVTHLKSLLPFRINGEFLYKDELFKQMDFVSLGNPLAHMFANICVSHLENTWLIESNRNAPVHYCRYVDDVHSVFHVEKLDVNFFFRFVNNHDSNGKLICVYFFNALSRCKQIDCRWEILTLCL